MSGSLSAIAWLGSLNTLAASARTSSASVDRRSTGASFASFCCQLSSAFGRACAARGGYIGVNGVGMFLGAEGPALPDAMADHVAHIAAIAGADRVGLGLDFMYLEGSDYGFFHKTRGRWPRGYPDPPWSFLQPEQIGDFVDAIAAKGFSAAELRGILGENYIRLAD